MKEFEKEFNQALQENKPVSQEARIAFDEAYQKIRKTEKTMKPKKRKGFLLAAVCLLLLGFSLSFTPIGRAVSNFLKFGQFSSKTLKEGGFVTKQKAVSEDKELEIELKEVYADQNEIGLHFLVTLPKGSKFTNEKLDYYNLNFALKNGDGNYLLDFKSKIPEANNTNILFGMIAPEFQYDASNRTLELTYRLHANGGNVPKLENAVIEVTGLSATYELPMKPGLQEGVEGETYEETRGMWHLPIDTSKIKEFEPVQFAAAENSPLTTAKGTAYPSSFVMTLEPSEYEQLPTDGMDVYLKATINGKESRFLNRSILYGEATEDNQVQLTFDYDGYDQADSIIFYYNGFESELRRTEN